MRSSLEQMKFRQSLTSKHVQPSSSIVYQYWYGDISWEQLHLIIPKLFSEGQLLTVGIIISLCYLYGRATKAVSICPPAYYADILCERGRCYLQKYINGRYEPGHEFDSNESPWYQQGVALG